METDPLPPGSTGSAPRATPETAPDSELNSLREANSQLVETLQELQRERAGDALEGVLVQVDRTITGMLGYIEDLRRTREQLVRGVHSVADRLAEIEPRGRLGAAGVAGRPEPATEKSSEPPIERAAPVSQPIEPADRVDPASPPQSEILHPDPVPASVVLPPETEIGRGPDVDDLFPADTAPPAATPLVVPPGAPADGPRRREGDRSAEAPGAEAPVAAEAAPIDLVVHGCATFDLIGSLQESLAALPSVEGLRVRRFHRGSLYMTVSTAGAALAQEIAGLDVQGRRLRILETGEGRIEATFPGADGE